VSIKFQIPRGCEVSQLIANLTAHLGLKSEGHGGGSDMMLRAWDRYLIFNFRDLRNVNALVYGLRCLG
jgi:hypothetical protein